jgi:hypothetical protein
MERLGTAQAKIVDDRVPHSHQLRTIDDLRDKLVDLCVVHADPLFVGPCSLLSANFTHNVRRAGDTQAQERRICRARSQDADRAQPSHRSLRRTAHVD